MVARGMRQVTTHPESRGGSHQKRSQDHVPPEERIATFDNDDNLRQAAAYYHAGKRGRQRSLHAGLALPHPDPYRILEIQFIEV